MNEVKLGQLITKTVGRDAVHIAVAPVVAGYVLAPGEHVGLLPCGDVGPCSEPVGIVDPYLLRPVQPGETFYLCLYPNTVTSLRHVWTHPAFAPKLKGSTNDE